MALLWKKHKNKCIAAAVIVAVLVIAWMQGGGSRGGQPQGTASVSPSAVASVAPSEATAPESEAATEAATEEPSAKPTESEATATETAEATAQAAATPTAEPTATPVPTPTQVEPTQALNPDTGKDKFLTDLVPKGKPLPVEPQDAVIGTTALTCTLSVRCDTILANMSSLNPDKAELVPADGVIFPPTVVTFYEGESVFNVLQREMRRNGIHMEFVNTPIYNSAYIEGIHNLYEFDCGGLSGWMYKVNGWFPNYGCSRYVLQDGDVVEWVYTCDLGRDVGGGGAVGGGGGSR